MHLVLAPLLALAAGLALPAADEAVWRSDYAAAVAEATKAQRPLLLDFTGSDWCGWCMKLKSEVFATPAFKTWAAGKVVLVEVDFPRGKAQSAAEKRQNDELAQRFEIQGYPTIILLDATGKKKLGELGYLEGGPGAWTAKADALLTAK